MLTNSDCLPVRARSCWPSYAFPSSVSACQNLTHIVRRLCCCRFYNGWCMPLDYHSYPSIHWLSFLWPSNCACCHSSYNSNSILLPDQNLSSGKQVGAASCSSDRSQIAAEHQQNVSSHGAPTNHASFAHKGCMSAAFQNKLWSTEAIVFA